MLNMEKLEDLKGEIKSLRDRKNELEELLTYTQTELTDINKELFELHDQVYTIINEYIKE